MNCLEFRRILNTNPQSEDREFLQHQRECPSCSAVAARSAELERALAEAVRVDVPEGLSSRILQRQRLEEAPNPGRRRALYALAASVVLGVGIGAGLLMPRQRSSGRQDLEQGVVERIRAEPYAMEASGALGQDQIEAMMRRIGADLTGHFGEVRFGHLCAVGRHPAAHFVVDGRRGPVTILIIPKQEVPRPAAIEDDGLRGMLVPIRGGSMAVVGRPGENLQPVVERVREAVRWRL